MRRSAWILLILLAALAGWWVRGLSDSDACHDLGGRIDDARGGLCDF